MDMYTFWCWVIGIGGAVLVLEFLRYNKACVAAWWNKKIAKEMRAAASWADCQKLVRVYKGENENDNLLPWL